MLNKDKFSDDLISIVGKGNVLLEDLDVYAIDWRKKFFGKPLLVVRPGSTEEVSAVIKLCALNNVKVVPQGGNTGLCGGATPDQSGEQVVLTLSRLNKVREVNVANNTMTVEAGCVLQSLQEIASTHDRLFPLSLGAEGSCQIGGNIATNAGGVQVLRYGNTRDLVLGLEVVLPDGRILNMLRGLRKDNTGYDLKQLFIGSEGTLGVITAATLKLFSKPTAEKVAFAAVESPQKAIELLQEMRSLLGERFAAFEIMSGDMYQLVSKYFPDTPKLFPDNYPWYVLMEAADGGANEALEVAVEGALEVALEKELIIDVVIASNVSQANEIWQLRENVAEAQQHDGANIKHDISMPISDIPQYIDETSAALADTYTGVRLFIFGHLGDGNLHFNASTPPGISIPDWQKKTSEVNDIVHRIVHRFGGSISAEHGIGRAKHNDLITYKSEEELSVMREIKKALDPLSMLNPGKVVSTGQ